MEREQSDIGFEKPNLRSKGSRFGIKTGNSLKYSVVDQKTTRRPYCLIRKTTSRRLLSADPSDGHSYDVEYSVNKRSRWELLDLLSEVNCSNDTFHNYIDDEKDHISGTRVWVMPSHPRLRRNVKSKKSQVVDNHTYHRGPAIGYQSLDKPLPQGVKTKRARTAYWNPRKGSMKIENKVKVTERRGRNPHPCQISDLWEITLPLPKHAFPTHALLHDLECRRRHPGRRKYKRFEADCKATS